MVKIAIDGYSGSGKGELSKGLAKKFNLKHLDTGAILRAIGLYFYKKNITDVSQEDILNNISKIKVEVVFDGDNQKTILCGDDVSSEIRQEIIGQMASRVAVFPEAMGILIQTSQAFAKKYDCVMDGRNITSEVLPDADVKIFLTASLECRAKRRLADDQKKGIQTSYEKVLNSLEERDFRDTHRKFSAMVIVPDAIVFDNTTISIEDTINQISEIVTNKLKQKGKI